MPKLKDIKRSLFSMFTAAINIENNDLLMRHEINSDFEANL